MKRLICLLAIALICVGFSGCSLKTDPLVGKWEFYGANGSISNYEFTADKKVTIDSRSLGSWFRQEYMYELNDGSLILKNGKYIVDGESTDVLDEKPKPCSVEGDTLTLGNRYSHVRVNNFTNEYESEGMSTPTYSSKSGYVFTSGQYSAYEDLPKGAYDLQWVSGNGTCTTDNNMTDYRKMSEAFGDGKGEIKEYKNNWLDVSSRIGITGTLKIMFIPK